jgi:hypothetical protein
MTVAMLFVDTFFGCSVAMRAALCVGANVDFVLGFWSLKKRYGYRFYGELDESLQCVLMGFASRG